MTKPFITALELELRALEGTPRQMDGVTIRPTEHRLAVRYEPPPKTPGERLWDRWLETRFDAFCANLARLTGADVPFHELPESVRYALEHEAWRRSR